MQKDVHEVIQGISVGSGGSGPSEQDAGNVVGEEHPEKGAGQVLGWHGPEVPIQPLEPPGKRSDHGRESLQEARDMSGLELHDLNQHEVEEIGVIAQLPHERVGGVANKSFDGIPFNRVQNR